MFKGERGFFVLVIIALVFAAAAWIVMRPAFPNLPTSEYKQAKETEYSPGSPRCYPSRIEGLPKREAMDERYRCETQAEKHRQQSDDLAQQTRAANAGEAIVDLTYRQTLMALAGTIFGLLTLLAAAYAAWYARRAAEAGHKSNEIAIQAQRPWIAIEVEPNSPFYFEGKEGKVSLDVRFKNCGKKVATDLISQGIMYTGKSRASERMAIVEEARAKVHENQAKADYNRRIALPGYECADFQTVRCEALPDAIYRIIVYVEYKIEGEGGFKYGWAGFDLLRVKGDYVTNISTSDGTMVGQERLRLHANGIGDAN